MRSLMNRAGRGLLTLLIGVLLSQPSSAKEVLLSLYYHGEPGGQFTNITPKAGFCSQWPAYCAGVETVDLPLEYTKISIAGARDKRDLFAILPATTAAFTVTDPVSRQQYTVAIEILSVSQKVHGKALNNPVNTRTVLGGCSYNKSMVNGDQWTSYLWNVTAPNQPQLCYSDNQQAQPGEVVTSEVSDLAIGYRLTSLPPFSMKPGRYQGTLNYNIGPGWGFDFGNGVSGLSASIITLRLEMDVRPPLRIDFPPGSDRVALEPPGGWASWLSHGRPPQRLFRDLQFQTTVSGAFRAYKVCQYPMGEGCGIRNEDNHQVPVKVGLTLPDEVREGRQVVRKREIPSAQGSPLQLQAETAVAYRRSQLHFEVGREHVQEMLKHPGSTYRGDVTVVFEASL